MVGIGKTVVAAALVGALGGGLGSMGWFFWANREVSPCATAGLDGATVEAAVPLTPEVDERIVLAAGLGAAVAAVAAALFVVPPALRLRRVMRGGDGRD
jgi:hypothetical protein